MRYLSVCSGIEAASVAWQQLGWEPVAFSEFDKFPSAVLAARHPDVQNLGDMTKFEEWPKKLLAQADVLVGGTPCQAFSVAGRKQSLSDDRGNLTLMFFRLRDAITKERARHGLPPAITVWENVPGVLSTRDNAFGCFLSGMLGLEEAVETETGKWAKAGFLRSEAFGVGYRVLDAQFFGVAQRRRRVFLIAVPAEVIASSGGRACPSKILSLRESMLGYPPTRGAAWEGVARATASSLTSSGRGVERPGESRGQDDVVLSMPTIARTLTKRMHKGFDGSCDSQTPIVFHPTQDPIPSEGDVTHAVSAGTSGGYSTVAVAFTKSKRAQSNTDDETWVPGDVVTPVLSFKPGQGADARSVGESCEVSCTLEGAANGNAGHKVAVSTPMSVRRLTPRECERLQGFPDDYTAIEYRGKPAADGPRYKALGNSMAVPCMLWLGSRIASALEAIG